MLPADVPQVRVLIADDSTMMRTALVRVLESSPMIRVCGTARNGVEAVEKTKLLQPDVVTLDVNMPLLDGLEALKRIMRESPRPVVMVNSLTSDGADLSIEAIEAGAFGCLAKEDLQEHTWEFKTRHVLIEKVEAAARSALALRRRTFQSAPLTFPQPRPRADVVPRVVVIGTSTGGPKALQDILPELPSDLPVGILIVQHMPPGFTANFAKRLDGLCRLRVCEARHGERLDSCTAYIAPAGRHLTVFNNRLQQAIIALSDTPAETVHRPSVDVTMLSIASVFGEYSLGVILTGMGCDGLEGMTAIRDAGGVTIGQDESSSAVYGMPRACADRGVLQRILPLDKIPDGILSALNYRVSQ
jgi:two-component system chemotaxis response regulator CheB